jgi:hypothetical protein
LIPPIIADTGGLLRALARTPAGQPSFPEYERILTSAAAVIVPGFVLAEVDYFLRAERSGRLIGQLLTESVVLCLLGGAAGVAVAYLLLHAAGPLVAASLPFTADFRLDLRVLAFAATAAMAVLILAGLLPSVRISFSKLSTALNQAGRGSSGPSAAVRRTIVVAEVSASVMLICGAALLFKSLAKLRQVDAGVRIDRVITMSADLSLAAYPSPESAVGFYEAVVQRLRAAPGVEQASVSQRSYRYIVEFKNVRTLERFVLDEHDKIALIQSEGGERRPEAPDEPPRS